MRVERRQCMGDRNQVSLGKLALAKPLGELLPPLLADAGIELLRIEIADVARVATLPFHHRDVAPTCAQRERPR